MVNRNNPTLSSMFGAHEIPNRGTRDDPDLVFGRLLRDTREDLGMEVAYISEFVDGRRVIRFVDSALSQLSIRVGDSQPLEESICQRVVDGRLPALIPDTSCDPEARLISSISGLTVGAHLAVPLRMSDGCIYGTICCINTTPDLALHERDVATLWRFAQFAARYLERERMQHREMQIAYNRISRVIDKRLFSLVFQPILSAHERWVKGFEFFTRFNTDPQRAPVQWFGEASQAGLLKPLEIAVIERALHYLPEIPEGIYLSINISPDTIQACEPPTLFSNRPLDRLVLEISEHSAVSDYEALQASLAPLRKRGLRLAVDDAGGGYSQLRHLRILKPNIVKIDQRITHYIDTDTRAQALASAIIRYARLLDITVVAEGVETEGQCEVMQKLGADQIQGYLAGRPVAFEDLCRAILKTFRNTSD